MVLPDEAAGKQEEAEMIRSILEVLPDRQREAIVLRFFEELSIEDAARAMSCAPGTVKATVHQGAAIAAKQTGAIEMTELRRQLDQERAQYAARRYPGDLAADLVASAGPTTRSLLWQVAAGTAAVAALVVLIIWLGQAHVDVPIVTNDDQNAAFEAAPLVLIDSFPALTMPEEPEQLSYSVEAPSLSFSMPSFPSFLTSLSGSDSSAATTKETI